MQFGQQSFSFFAEQPHNWMNPNTSYIHTDSTSPAIYSTVLAEAVPVQVLSSSVVLYPVVTANAD